MTSYKYSGPIGQLRIILDMAERTRWDGWVERSIDPSSIRELITICESCILSGFDVYPDQLTEEEFKEARLGNVANLTAMLEQRFG